MDTLFKPVAIDYNLGSVNGFDRVNITMKNDKYLISFYMSGKYGGETFFEIKDAIIGGMGFLANEQDINNHFKFYENYDECIEVLKSRNLKNLIYDFDKFKVNSSRFLLAIKLVENTTKKFTSYFDDNGEPIFVGDGLKSKWNYEVTVMENDNEFIGKLICDDKNSCKNIPYDLNKGAGFSKIIKNK